MNRLKNKIALITGGAQGIGAATAKLFVEEGAKVIITDVNDEAGKKKLDSLNGKASYFHLDVSKEVEWQNVMEKIEAEFGRLDILFNNAGIIGMEGKFGPQDPENASLESWHIVHAINLDGVFLGCKYAIKIMKKHGGSIINMSSRSGIVGIPGAAAYASSKAAIRNHTKTVALYCAQQNYNIRCNSVHPGAIMTSLWDPMLGKNEDRAKSIETLTENTPLKRFGTPEEVAHAVLFLASDEASYITGTELNIDGGILAGSAASPGKK